MRRTRTRRTAPAVLPLGPDAVEVGARTLVLGDGVCTTYLPTSVLAPPTANTTGTAPVRKDQQI